MNREMFHDQPDAAAKTPGRSGSVCVVNAGSRCTRRVACVMAVLIVCLGFSQVRMVAVTNRTWTDATSGGLWSSNANWSGGMIADGTDAVADFSMLNITSDNTVHLDSTRTVGSLLFGDQTPSNNWTLDNNGSTTNILTLAVSNGTPTITVVDQTAMISAVLTGSSGLTKTGPGTLALNASVANTLSGTSTVAGGILDLKSSGALGSSSVQVQSGAEVLSHGSTYANAFTLAGTGVNGAGSFVSVDPSGDILNGPVAITGGGATISTPFTVPNGGTAITFNGGIDTGNGSI